MELQDLYREVILDHNKRPRNFGRLDPADALANGHNPLCGDRLTVTLNLSGDHIDDVKFEGNGCAISKASASLMTDAIKGHTVAEANELFEAFHAMVTTPISDPVDESKVGKLAVFSGVREFPARVKCAILSWHAAKAAVAGGGTVSTEGDEPKAK